MITRGVQKIINRTKNFRSLSRKHLLGLVLAAACIFISSAKSNAKSETPDTNDSLRYLGGLRNSPDAKKLNPKQLDIILKSLREKTGYQGMLFDENGFLNLGDRMKFSGGSETARALLRAAVDSNKSIDLECHNHSETVAFARLERSTVYESRATGKRIDVYPLQIDFSDFSHLRGDKKVIAAFDVGFVIMHELGHALLGLHDPSIEADGPGECEDFINRIRRELKLPERQNYIARTRSIPYLAFGHTHENAELTFVHQGDGSEKTQSYYLLWEASEVGPVRVGPPPQPKGTLTARTAAAY